MDCSGRMQSHIHPSSPFYDLHTNTPATQLQTCIVIQTDRQPLHPSDELSTSAQFTQPPLHRFPPLQSRTCPSLERGRPKYLARAPVSTLNGTVEMLSNTWRSAKRRRLTAGFAECSSQLWQPQGMMVRSFGNGAWRPGSVLDEYVAAHQLEKGDMLTLLASQMGGKGGPSDQLAPAHGLRAVVDRIEAHQLCQLRPHRASHKVRPLGLLGRLQLYREVDRPVSCQID